MERILQHVADRFSFFKHGMLIEVADDNVSFRLLKGEHVGLIGANGEGKSTFMNIITGKHRSRGLNLLRIKYSSLHLYRYQTRFFIMCLSH
jgi:ATPase subunit of ABC transporter with duplicated ATPase domains